VNKNIISKIRDCKIAITGSNGFIASHLVAYLQIIGVQKKSLLLINSKTTDYSLKNLIIKFSKIDLVIHLSSATGGIKYTKDNMATQLYTTMTKDLNVFQAAKICKVKKVLTLGNFHAYPSQLKKNINEEYLFNGLPAPTHLGIGWSKRNLAVLSNVFSRNSNTKFIILYSANAYGPGDSLDLNYGHIIPSFIIKCLKNKNIKLFGGSNAIREFVYVKDLIFIILNSLIKIKESCHINVGSNEKIKIKDLIKLISQLTNFKKKVIFQNKIKDQSIRFADKERFNKIVNYKNKYNLESGLKETILWYKKKLKK
jgi:GDP-L-fucose synthase